MSEPRESVGAIEYAPPWLRFVGVNGWLIVGVAAALFIAGWFISFTSSIMIPLIIAMMFGVIFAPIVDVLHGRKLPRQVGAVITLVLILTVFGVAGYVCASAIVGQIPSIQASVESAWAQITAWLATQNIPQSTIDNIGTTIRNALPSISQGVTSAISSGLSGITAFVFGAFLALFMLYLVMADWPNISKYLASHMGLPTEIGLGIMDDTSRSLRGYFRGSTIIGLANVIVIALGMWALGVPLILPVAVVTMVLCYIPFFGAIVSGAFAVIVALGSQGPETAMIMLVIVLVSQNLVQMPIQAWAMGDALDLHPIVVLVSTMIGSIFGGLLGGMIGAPLTAIGVQVLERINRANIDIATGQVRPGSAPESAPEPAA